MRVSRCVSFRLVLCLGTLVACGVAAFAAQQTTQRKASLREGPGSFFPVVKRLQKGTTLEVGETRGTWVAGQKPSCRGWLPGIAFQDSRAPFTHYFWTMPYFPMPIFRIFWSRTWSRT